MGALEFYQNIDSLRDSIWHFNVRFYKNDIVSVPGLFMKILKKVLYSDIRDDIFNFSEDECEYWMAFFTRLQNAVEAKDTLYIYDCFNVELTNLFCRMLKILWNKYVEELKDFFWHENSASFGSRYLEILSKIESSRRSDDEFGIREYGMKGQVLYLKEDIWEHDLYCEYNPNDYVYHVLKRYDLGKYNKIFIWTLGGDFDIGVLFQFCAGNEADIEVYVANIEIFGEFLHNTIRKGALLEQRIKYNFERTIECFLEDVCLEKNVYVYIGAYSLSNIDEKEKVVRLLVHEQIDSNIVGEKNEEHFICKQRIEKNG